MIHPKQKPENRQGANRAPLGRPHGGEAVLATSTAALLPDLRQMPGLTLKPGVSLARCTTLRIGGPAELLVEVSTEGALVALLRAVAAHRVPFCLFGMGSNILVPDEGVAGVVARFSGRFCRYRVSGQQVRAGAAVSLARLAKRMAARGLRGLEALSGFPSTVGGAVWMNAGAYGTEMKDLLVSVRVVERDGHRHRLEVQELAAGYRCTALQRTGGIVTAATLQLQPCDPAAALERIEQLNRRRWASLPSGLPNAGSIFKNPSGDFAGRLIEACDLKGLRRGAAQISPKHANVIVNTGGASAADVLGLMVEAYRTVKARFAVELEPEIVLAGDLEAQWRQARQDAGKGLRR